MNTLHSATILMAAAVIIVPISRRFGFGSILGYIIAGLVIGPAGFNLISNAEQVLHFSEIGIVLLLFIIGLQMKPARLWALKNAIFGVGAAQTLITTCVLAALAVPFVGTWSTALVIGFGLSLSSTAFALQLIAERKQLAEPHARSALHILLFQDLAVIPVLAIIPIVGAEQLGSNTDIVKNIVITISILFAFWLFARFLLRPILHFVAAAGVHEIFISAALLLVLGSAFLMQSIGISMALGAFLAGVLVASSEYRYQLEADIEPFKGLLLGLFFMAVGMSANLNLLVANTGSVVLIAATIVCCKAALLFLTAQLVKLNTAQAVLLAVCLSQGGEFGFIIFSLSAQYNLMTKEHSELLIMAITLSMMMTPVLLYITEQWLKKSTGGATQPDYDVIDTPDPRVIIAGFGRFGQIIARIMRIQNIAFTAIEINPGHVDFVRKLGSQVHYGDASHKQLLDTAGTDKADVFVLAIGHVETSIKIAEIVKRNYPNIRLFARARNRRHEIHLRDLGVDGVIRDTLLSSMQLAEQILLQLGLRPEQAAEVKEQFYRHDAETLSRQIDIVGDPNKLIKSQRDALQELEGLFSNDKTSFSKHDDKKT